MKKLLIVSLLLCGCATRYHREKWGTGYSEIKAAPDAFIVTFRGNGYTSSEKVYQYALTRAAELTLNNGYRYFSVTSTEDKTSSYDYTNTQSSASTSGHAHHHRHSSHGHAHGSSSSSTYSGTVSMPGITLGIRCYHEKPRLLDALDARYFLDYNPK